MQANQVKQIKPLTRQSVIESAEHGSSKDIVDTTLVCIFLCRSMSKGCIIRSIFRWDGLLPPKGEIICLYQW